MKGAEIVGTLLRAYKPLTALVPFQFIQMGQLPDDAPMDTVLVRSVSLVDTHFLKAETMQHSIERVAVAVRASDYLGQVAILEEVRAALRGFTGGLAGAQSIAIHTAGLGPDLRGPGGSFERTQDLRVSYDVVIGPVKLALGGAVLASSVLAGSLTSAGLLAGIVVGASEAAGQITTAQSLDGAIDAAGRVQGIPGIMAALSGALSAGGWASGSIAISARLAGQSSGAGNMSGSMSRLARLSAQAAGAGTVSGVLTSAVVYDPDAQAYFNAMTVQPTAARKALISDFIAGLRADNAWTVWDWVVLLASHDAQAHLIDARRPSRTMIAINSPTFTVDRGSTGDGAQSYLSAGETWQASGNFGQDSATLGVWCNLAASSNQAPQIGVVGSGASLINPSPTQSVFRMNNVSNLTASTTGKTGHRTVSRTDATTVKGYLNGALIATTTAITSQAPSTGAGCALRGNSVYSSDRLAALYSGGGATDAQIAAMQNRLNTFLSAIGAQ